VSIEILLDELEKGLPTISSKNGTQLAEMALFCLSKNKHNSGVSSEKVEGNCQECNIKWNFQLDPRTEGSYKDIDEVTEYGATAIAILYAIKLTGQNTVERSAKGNGFDYWVGTHESWDDSPFLHTTRLEISGIFHGTPSKVKERYKVKQKQITKSDYLLSPKIVFIFEFSKPLSAVEYIR